MGIFDDALLDNLEEKQEKEQVEAQEGENEALEEQGEPQEEQEKLILGKFKSVEELAKAYKELEKKLGKDAEEKAALRKEIEEIRKLITGPKDAKEQKKEDSPEDWLERFYSEGPKLIQHMVSDMLAQHLAPIQQFMTQEYYNRQARELAAKYKDFADYVEDMEQIFNEYPEIASHPRGMEIAYRLAKANRLEAELPRAVEKAQEEGKKAALEKQAARMPSSSGRKTEKAKSPEELIKESIFGGEMPQGIFG